MAVAMTHRVLVTQADLPTLTTIPSSNDQAIGT